MKTIYYYQTVVNLDKLLTHTEDIDVLIVSSIHFDKTRDQKPGIFSSPCSLELYTEIFEQEN